MKSPPRPTLLNSRKARTFKILLLEDTYKKKLEEPKKNPYIVEDAEHIDLYDPTNRIPF